MKNMPTKPDTVEAPEEWKRVEGITSRYGRWYEVSNLGRIRSTGGFGTKTRYMTPFPKTNSKGSTQYLVKLSTGERGYLMTQMSKLVWNAFMGELPKGAQIVHRDGVKGNNRLENLTLMNKQQLGKRYGGRSRRRGIAMIDEDGETVEIYRSSREAAKATNMSYQTVLDRCNGRVKNEYALTGCTFRWDD